MRTGEGKTLVAVLPAYLNALAGASPGPSRRGSGTGVVVRGTGVVVRGSAYSGPRRA